MPKSMSATPSPCLVRPLSVHQYRIHGVSSLPVSRYLSRKSRVTHIHSRSTTQAHRVVMLLSLHTFCVSKELSKTAMMETKAVKLALQS
jgi:hypothetical protein